MRTFAVLVVFSSLLSVTSRLLAQDGTAAVAAPGVSPSAATGFESVDAAPQRLLQTLADQELSQRFANSYTWLIAGAGVIAAGLIADFVYDRDYGRVLWMVGVGGEISAASSLIRRDAFEQLASEAQGWTPAELEHKWAERALEARSDRRVGGFVGLGVGALLIGSGVALAAGAIDMKADKRQDNSTLLLAFGSGFIGGALNTMFVESPFETTYRAAYGRDPERPKALAMSLSPTFGGAALGVRGNF